MDNLEKKEQISFKVLKTMDPDPSLPKDLFKKVSFDEFIVADEKCFPVFVETHLGIFPEDIIPESLEGQKIALLGNSLLNAPITIVQIMNWKRKTIKMFLLDENE